MKYIKYEDLLNNHELRIMKVELKPRAKITEVEWFNHMVSGVIVKVSDTIEELCDKFIKIRPNLPPLISQNGILWGWKKPTEEVYGAIFTDKGLIYVAKMNDEGELELL